jgi:hypothetical protein
MDKHAAAVFSGNVPSAMEFLKPEETIEQTPDSLRDFIIALDKSKADKLRYKIEDTVVRIFITPYKTSLSQADLEFSQGDFNVDAVVALGVHEQQELDQAITTHGRILHDATIISINNTPNGNLGSMNWQDVNASSVCEMVVELTNDLNKEALDTQVSTALLTGIVAETERFSNDKTTPRALTIAGELMTAGANQQLVATSLQAAMQHEMQAPLVENEAGQIDDSTEQPSDIAPIKVSDDGTIEIDHGKQPLEEKEDHLAPDEPQEISHEETMAPEAEPPKIVTSHRSMLPTPGPADYHSLRETPFTGDAEYEDVPVTGRSYLADRADTRPTLSPMPEQGDAGSMPPSSDPMSTPIGRDEPAEPVMPANWQPEPPQPPRPMSMSLPTPVALPSSPSPAPAVVPPAVDGQAQTLSQIEASVRSPHLADQAGTGQDLMTARGQVLDALTSVAPPRLEPIQSLNAAPLGDSLRPIAANPSSQIPTLAQPPAAISVDPEGNLTQPGMPSMASVAPTVPQASTGSVPVPPPFNRPRHDDGTGQPGMVPGGPPSAPPPMTPSMYP